MKKLYNYSLSNAMAEFFNAKIKFIKANRRGAVDKKLWLTIISNLQVYLHRTSYDPL